METIREDNGAVFNNLLLGEVTSMTTMKEKKLRLMVWLV